MNSADQHQYPVYQFERIGYFCVDVESSDDRVCYYYNPLISKFHY